VQVYGTKMLVNGVNAQFYRANMVVYRAKNMQVYVAQFHNYVQYLATPAVPPKGVSTSAGFLQ
jgi:hypothetical protein